MLDRFAFPEESLALPGLDCRLRHSEATGSASQDSTLITDEFNGPHFERQFKKEQPSVQKRTPREPVDLRGSGHESVQSSSRV
jgi:hypothetical protein